MTDIEVVLDAKAIIGESPTWSPAEAALYWIDVKAPALHRLDPATGQQRHWPVTADIGAFALTETPPGAVVALRTGLFSLDFASGASKLLAKPPFDPSLTRFNEGACDSAGRFWVGTMFDPEPGVTAEARPSTLHCFTLGGGLVPEANAAELHNGAAWSPDEGVFYLSHSNQGEIYEHPYDPRTGKLGPRRRFATVPKALGLPDGAAVDEDGYYWCAVHGGGRLHRYAPDGRLDKQVPLPVSQPTMCAFAGPELDTMFVTSASDNLTAEQLRAQPHAGALFRLTPGVRGTRRWCHVR